MEAMEARLVDSLHRRLADLEHKVQAYRHDSNMDFQHFCADLLRDVSPEAADRVRRTVALSFARYPALRPELDVAPAALGLQTETESRAPIIAGSAATFHPAQPSPLSSVLGTAEPTAAPVAATDAGAGAGAGSGATATVDTSAHVAAAASTTSTSTTSAASPNLRSHDYDREREFQGLFTPSYLPLLDCSPPAPRSSPVSRPTSAAAAAATTTTTTAVATADPGANIATAPSPSASATGSASATAIQPPLLPEPHQAGFGTGPGDVAAADMDTNVQKQRPSFSSDVERPTHVRRSTGDTTSSVHSDRSETKVRRSALRRSSSPSRIPTSPRRVRFEFMGAEVLPTASPEGPDFVTPNSYLGLSSLGEEDSPSSSLILGDSGEVEERLPPRKISSTEALRALSRTAIDEGTVWTVVDSSADRPARDNQPETSHVEDVIPAKVAPAKPIGLSSPQWTEPSPSHSSTLHQDHLDPLNNDDSSDDDFLTMGKTRSPVLTQMPVSPRASGVAEGEELARASTTTLSGKLNEPSADNQAAEEKDHSSIDDMDDGDDEELFHFENGGGLTPPPKPRRPPPPPIKEEEPEDDLVESPPPKDVPSPQQVYGTSPALPITRQPGSRGSTAAHFHAGSVGSYKGRPLVMPVVRDPEVLAQAASLGDFNTFVGGLDGRSGMDEGDLSSFRASMVHSGFSGTPRSLTERMMMEDAQMERLRQSSKPQ